MTKIKILTLVIQRCASYRLLKKSMFQRSSRHFRDLDILTSSTDTEQFDFPISQLFGLEIISFSFWQLILGSRTKLLEKSGSTASKLICKDNEVHLQHLHQLRILNPLLTNDFHLAFTRMIFIPDLISRLRGLESLHFSGSRGHVDQHIVISSQIKDEAIGLVHRIRGHGDLV